MRGTTRQQAIIEPLTNPLPVTPRRVIPWVIFAIALAVAVAGFFAFANRVPSLMQALADR